LPHTTIFAVLSDAVRGILLRKKQMHEFYM